MFGILSLTFCLSVLELLMEEFRIAHQRMFGGKENNGTLLGKIRQNKAAAAASSEESSAESSDFAVSSADPPKHPQQLKETNMMTRLVQSSSKVQGSSKVTAGSVTKESSSSLSVSTSSTVITPSARPSVAQGRHHGNGRENSGEQQSFSGGSSANSSSAVAHNRITIKVLSPKIGT